MTIVGGRADASCPPSTSGTAGTPSVPEMSDAGASVADGSVLVRFRPVDASRWLAGLPPAPQGGIVSVSATAAAFAGHADALAERGYVFAGVLPAPRADGAAVVDVLVPRALVDRAPVWWMALVADAWRALPTNCGPVGLVFARLLAAHARALRRHGVGPAV